MQSEFQQQEPVLVVKLRPSERIFFWLVISIVFPFAGSVFLAIGVTGTNFIDLSDGPAQRLTNFDRSFSVLLGALAYGFFIYQAFRYFKNERFRGVYTANSDGIELRFPSGRRIHGKWEDLGSFHFWREQLEFNDGTRIPLTYFGTAGFSRSELDKLGELSGGVDSPIFRARERATKTFREKDVIALIRDAFAKLLSRKV